MNTNELNMSGEGMMVARSMSRASLSFGLLLAVLGTFCVLAPLFTGIAVTTLIGVLFLAGGIAQVIHAFQSESLGKGVLRFLVGGLTAVAAVVILMKPGEGLGVLTIMLAGFFLAGGVLDIVISFKVPLGEGKGWMLFGGVVTIALATLIISGWPITGIWAVGIYVGVRLILHGMMLMAMGEAGKQALTQLQDTRIAALEQRLVKAELGLEKAEASSTDSKK